MDFISEWVSWSNFFYVIGLSVAGYATAVTAKNRQIVIEIGELVKALEDGMRDKKLDKAEKDKVMKEALDVAKAVIQSKWKLWSK
jgi:chemotaxis regulatin CheY-phosphate phosphatase CheZ